MFYKKSAIVLSLMLATTSARAAEGVGSSGGGGATVCRNATGQVVSAELLDLYEGAIRFGMVIKKNNLEPREQILGALSRFANQPYYGALIQETVKDVLSRFVFLPPGVGLSPGVDLGADYGVVIPDGCHLEYVGFYEADGTLKVAQSVFSALSLTDRAAFLVHEAVYKLARDRRGLTNSSLSRKLTASLFAQNVTEAQLMIQAPALFGGSGEVPPNFGGSVAEDVYVVLPAGLSNEIKLVARRLDLSQGGQSANLFALRNGSSVGQDRDRSSPSVLTIAPSQRCTDILFYVNPFPPTAGAKYSYELFYGGKLVVQGMVSPAQGSDGYHSIHFAELADLPEVPTLL